MRQRLVRHALALVLAVVAAGAAWNFGWLRPLDNGISELRMRVVPRAASGQLAYVAIDSKSLDEIGVWPWPRSIYARLIDKLMPAGVLDLAFDIDFSTASQPAEDAALKTALDNAGGAVILPAFLQYGRAGEDQASLTLTQPLAAFRDSSWIGSVSVVPDDDGVLRSYPYGIETEGEILTSFPALLGGVRETGQLSRFRVDYSINPATVPIFSVADVLSGKVGAEQLADKSVVVGAYAVELKDQFQVPVHGVISGPMMQILAAETLIQNRVGQVIPAILPLAVFSLGLLVILLIGGHRSLTQRLVTLLAALALAEVVALSAFVTHAIIVETSALVLFVTLMGIYHLISELDLKDWMMRVSMLETENTRKILHRVIADSFDAILIADESGRILELSGRTGAVFRLDKPARKGDPIAQHLPPTLVTEAMAAVAALKAGTFAAPGERSLKVNGGTVEYTVTPSKLDPTDRGRALRYAICISARDVTIRHEQEERLNYVSRHDVLTGALRQRELIAQLDETLAEQRWRGEVHAVYALDLHRFKTVNATLGRQAGDELLKEVTRRLGAVAPCFGPVARAGGDTFTMATRWPIPPGQVGKLAERIIAAVEAPYELGEHRARVGTRVGAASTEKNEAPTATMLVNQAELALDEVRQVNGSGWSLCDPSAAARVMKTRQIERELWMALDRNEISVSYQPQVELAGGRIIAAEALVRWNHPEFGVVSPADFVLVAEANGFVEILGRWVLKRACRDAVGWPEHMAVAVNVSPLQFTRGDIVGDVREALSSSRLPARRLHLEITESAFLHPSDELIAKLKALKALGVSLALDDFGTGYSSLGYLSRFPLDKIKVDQMFIRTLSTDPASRAIVRSVRSLCEGLGAIMVCEGVETETEAGFLRAIGCEQGQGYLFGRPQPADALMEMVRGAPARSKAV